MKNLLVLLIVFALTSVVSAAPEDYAPDTWGFDATGAGNPYTFDGPDGSNLTDQTPDVWGTWNGVNGTGDVTVSGGLCTIVTGTSGYEVVFSHDNALLDLGSPAPVAGGDLEVVLVVDSVSGPGYVSMKIEYYDTDVFANNDDGLGNIGIADWENPDTLRITTPGEYHFLTSDISFPTPAGTLAVTPVIVAAGGEATTVVLEEIWIGKPGEYPGATKASAPSPANGSIQPSGTVTTTSWTNPLPFDGTSALTVDWRIEKENATDGGGNFVYDPNWGAANGVPTTMVTKTGTDMTFKNFGFLTSPYTSPLADGLYSWRIDITDPSIGGPGTTEGTVWLFTVGDAPAEPNQPVNQFMFLSQADGDGNSNIRTFTVTANYVDDGKSPIVDANFVNLNWGWDPLGPDGTLGTGDEERGITKISEIWTPGAGTHTAGSVTATFQTHYHATDPNYSTDIMGYWDILLEVTDDTGTAQGIAGHFEIFETCGEAAYWDPDDPFDTKYDANLDCRTSLPDFADFALQWMSQGPLYE